jgi:hypothetical protein
MLAGQVVFRCCLQWGAFQAQKTSLFDDILASISAAVEQRGSELEALAYWCAALVYAVGARCWRLVSLRTPAACWHACHTASRVKA